MSVRIDGRYDGTLRVALRHGPSGREMTTAAPVDNQGDGSSFSPTDLVAAGLGSCALTLMAIVGEREGVPLEGLSFEVVKEMRSDPRRIDRLPLRINMPAGLDAGQRAKLETAAHTCPVRRSILAEIEVPFEFVYPD